MSTFKQQAIHAVPPATTAATSITNIVNLATNNTNTDKSNQTVYGAIQQLAKDCLAWQEGAYRTSNEQLYEILKNCYKLYKDMCGDTYHAMMLRETLPVYISKNNIVVKDSAHTMVKIVRCVFGNDRRRVSAYSIVLRAALVDKVLVNDVPEYISRNGGVEEMRLSKSKNYVPPKQKAALASNYLAASNLATVKTDALDVKLDAAKVGTQHVLIVTQHSDGSLVANALVSSQSVVTSALAAVYSANKSQMDNSATVMQTVSADTSLSNAINTAAQMAA